MVFEGQAPYLWWETKRRVSTPSILSVDYDRWGQTPEDLRQLATSAAHQRTRERFLALYEVTQASCATQVAARTRRHPADRDGVAAPLQHARPRGAGLPAHRRPPPLCSEIEAGLGEVVHVAQHVAAAPPLAGADPAPRWTLRRLVGWVEETFGRRCCRETIRRALHRLKLSWKKARKLLGRADPQRRAAFLVQAQDRLKDAQHDRHLLVYLDEAHIHQDAGLGYGWSARDQRFWVGSHSPRLADKLSFYGLYLYNEGEVRLWPYARANAEHTIDVLQRLRAEW